ncbi:hypothetical protein FRAHR75_800017 [Frankia sp. Hr75.2]|nr:hypothetical protein FRAHR75_800017 [Frankia sp. Hr75.2]
MLRRARCLVLALCPRRRIVEAFRASDLDGVVRTTNGPPLRPGVTRVVAVRRSVPGRSVVRSAVVRPAAGRR